MQILKLLSPRDGQRRGVARRFGDAALVILCVPERGVDERFKLTRTQCGELFERRFVERFRGRRPRVWELRHEQSH